MQAIKLLSTLSALRLEEKKSDHIETALTSLLRDGSESGAHSGMVTERNLTTTTGTNILASNMWEGVWLRVSEACYGCIPFVLVTGT